MQELFKDIIKNEVKPFLTGQGYSKKNLYFHKADGTLLYTFHFQKSHGNTWDHVMFYINCNIHSIELEQFESHQPGAGMQIKPHFISRIDQIIPSAPDRYSLTPETDPDKMSAALLLHLEEAIAFFDTMTSARAVVNYYMEKVALHLSEETLRFLLHAGDKETAQYYLEQLNLKYGAEKRWAIFEEKYKAIFAEY